MNNLPIISNNAQPPAKGAQKAAQGFHQPEGAGNRQEGAKPPASGQAKGKSTDGNPSKTANSNSSPASDKAANASSEAHNASDTKTAASQRGETQPTESFATLLARQIGETDTPTLSAGQVAIAIKDKMTGDAAQPAIDEVQDQTAANTPVDPANTLATILLQLPQEMRTQVTHDAKSNAAATSIANDKLTGIATLKTDSHGDLSIAKPEIAKPEITKPEITKPEIVKPEIASVTLKIIDASAAASDKQIISDALIRDAAKQAGLSTNLPQPTANIAQSITSSAISAAIPNMLTSNNTAIAPQGIATPLGNSGWADDFSQKINWMSTQRNQIAELHLNPPDLGPLNVVLKISDNQATALFTSPHSAVRDAVENALPKLRETLAENGITLGNTTVSDQPPRDRDRETFMNQGTASAQREISTDASRSAGLSDSTAQGTPIRRHNGMVDTFA